MGLFKNISLRMLPGNQCTSPTRNTTVTVITITIRGSHLPRQLIPFIKVGITTTLITISNWKNILYHRRWQEDALVVPARIA